MVEMPFPDAVLLDLDNTIYEYESAHRAAMESVKTRMLEFVALTDSQFEDALSDARIGVKNRLGLVAASHNRLLYFQTMFENLGLGPQPLNSLDLEQTYWRTFLRSAELFDGVVDFLDELRLRSIPVCVITDLTSQIQMRKIIYFGLDRLVSLLVTSEEAGAEKPALAPFLLAVEKLGFVDGKYWMIGDDPDSDIAAAHESIGAFTLQKLHKGVRRGKGSAKPHLTFRHFSELTAGLNGGFRYNEEK